jgi:hypothetical protein
MRTELGRLRGYVTLRRLVAFGVWGFVVGSFGFAFS